MALATGVKTNIKWINDIAQIPILGGALVFILIFIPAVLLSFTAHAPIPGLKNDIGFTKAMLILLPVCNAVLWWRNIKLYTFFLPAWLLFGGIALVKITLYATGVSDEL